MVTGILLALVGVLVHYAGSKWIDIIMPPVVNGAIVAIIGFNLAPSVWTNFQAAPDTALVTLLAVLLVAVLFKGLLGRLNILVGVIIGYVYACIRGQVDFSAIGDAAWIGFPKFHLPQADFSILPMFIPVVLVLVAENVGHVKSVAPNDRPRLRQSGSAPPHGPTAWAPRSPASAAAPAPPPTARTSV